MRSVAFTSLLLGLSIGMFYALTRFAVEQLPLIRNLCGELCLLTYEAETSFVVELATYDIWNYFVFLILSMVGGCFGVVLTGAILICILLGWKTCIYEIGVSTRQTLLGIFER